MIKVESGYRRRRKSSSFFSRRRQLRARALESLISPVTNAAEVIERNTPRGNSFIEGVREYTYRIIVATRTHPRLTLGASPRAGIQLLAAAQAAAAIAGRDFATPDDVKDVADLVIPHRLIVAPDAEIEGISAKDILRDILAQIPVPRGDAPLSS
jgi:MoxR-like ATPase